MFNNEPAHLLTCFVLYKIIFEKGKKHFLSNKKYLTHFFNYDFYLEVKILNRFFLKLIEQEI